ncbi:Putative odorant receptor 13a [Trachymyrmex zeteki]|uniref:Putative odorant receptor 13a n=1 Tax=Mycetomoellerius zeteki TaxID=64791 RepID=A0A151XJC6_9HYME|nr:Putative odorant receptor 13a [Trachymyrmex zeteki]
MSQRDNMITNTVTLSVQIGLQGIGFWPNTPCALLFRCFWILTIGIVQTFQYWWIIIHLRTDNMSYLMDSLSVTIEYSVMSLKLIILWFNSRIFHDVLAAMAADWREATSNEIHIMMNKANLSRRFSNVIIGLHSVAVMCFGIEVLASHTDNYDTDYGIETPVRAFTLKLQLPSQCNESPLYELVMSLEFFHQLAAAIANAIFNSLLITLILHTSGQIEILCDTLSNISPKMNNQQLNFCIKEVIGKHQKIITFSDKIDKIFSYIALIQFMSSILLTCCLGFTVVTSINTMKDSDTIDNTALIKAIVFYMAATVEAFTFCFCGEYLTAKSKMIGDAAYKSVWYDFTPKESKLVLLIILRSQRRLTITAGNMMDLSLEGFTRRASTISLSVEAGLRFIGMWPHCVYSNINWWTYIISVAIMQYFQYAYILAHFDISDLSVFVDGLSITFGYSLSFFKLINLWFNRRKLFAILDTMDKDWSDGIAINSDVSTMIRYANWSRQCSNIMITTNALAVFFYVIGGLIRSIIQKNDGSTRELPIKMEFPFKVDNSPIFELILILQFFHDLSVACIIAMLNALLVTLVLHVSGQIDIMLQGFMEISSKHTSKSSLAAIKDLVNRHQRIIDLSDDIEDLFSNIALLQFIWNTLVICCIGFVIVISIGTEEGSTMITKSLIFYVAITLEAFVFCYAGEYLSAKSKSISDAAYECLWYDLTPSECRILMFLMLRSQKRLTITAGKITDLSLEGFTTDLRFIVSLHDYSESDVFIAHFTGLGLRSLRCIDNSYESTMISVADLSHRCTNVMISINALAAFFLSIGEHLLQSMGDINGVDNNSRELPIKMEFPFDVSESPIFECFLIGQFLYELVLASIVGMVNALLVSLILHVSGQIDIMQQDINEISNSKYNPSLSLIVIKGLICKHQKIITLSENIENLYTYIALMQLLWNTLVICCTGFVIIISRSISDAVYESLWYNMPPTNSRILLFMILRSQKRLTITAGKVVDLTLEGFTNVRYNIK